MLVGHLKGRLAKLLEDHDEIVIWGAGSFGDLALYYLPERVLQIVDSYSDIKTLQNIPVVRPHTLKGKEGRFLIVICSTAYKEIEIWLRKHEVSQPSIRIHELLIQACENGSLRSCLAADLFNYWKGSYFETFVSKPQCIVNFSYRCVRALGCRTEVWSKILTPLVRLLHSFNCIVFSLELPSSVEAGPYLAFPHPFGVVIHESVKIGNFCTIYQGATLGANARGQVPKLGHNVVIWAGAVVVGDCLLGNGTEVGANATCVGPMDVQNAVLVGTPARILKQY